MLENLCHPFIIKLRWAFQTQKKLFLIMDYFQRGDLNRALNIEGRFTEDRARIYFCEILLIIEYLHAKNILFRDTKPENFLVDETGHLVMTDFGLAKDLGPETSSGTFCGSVAYIAPEMLIDRQHGKPLDWYLLGLLLYEMMTGIIPFYSKNREEFYANIR
jgi:serine/threonine protein kinase